MTDKQQPEALRLAEILEHPGVALNVEEAAAAELRRLHDVLGKANALNRIRQDRITELENALRQCVDAMEDPAPRRLGSDYDKRLSALKTARQTLKGNQ